MLSVKDNVAFAQRKSNNVASPKKSHPGFKASQLSFSGDQVSFSSKKAADNVSFNGLLNSKAGKLGIIGAALLAVFGVAVPTVKAHTLVNEQGIVLKHKHELPDRVGFYADSRGNVVVRAQTASERIDPGMQEYERVFDQYNQPLGWRPITRVFNKNNVQTGIERGELVANLADVNPNVGNLPGWAGEVVTQTPPGGVIVVPAPGTTVITPQSSSSSSMQIYFDSEGNWGVRAQQNFNSPDYSEYERIDGGWRQITRVERNGTMVIERGTIIYGELPHLDYGIIPLPIRRHILDCHPGHRIFLPRPGFIIPHPPVFRSPHPPVFTPPIILGPLPGMGPNHGGFNPHHGPPIHHIPNRGHHNPWRR